MSALTAELALMLALWGLFLQPNSPELSIGDFFVFLIPQILITVQVIPVFGIAEALKSPDL
jgi:hypothetical protein